MMRARLSSLFSSQSLTAPWPVVLVFVLCIMSISGSISMSSVLGVDVGVGDRVYINFANIMSGLNSGSVFNNDPCADQPGTATRQEIAVDYLIVGGGPGGLQTASELLSALRNSTDVGERASSVMLVEAQNEIGGNIKRVKIIQPSDYDGSFGSDGLYADLGAQRVNVLTLTEERRLFHQLGIELYATPFRNIVNLRGRQLWCRTPDVQAHEHFPYYASTPDPADVFAYGDFCTYADVFTHPDTGAYKNVRSRTNFQGCTNTDNTAENVCTSFPNNDPGYNAYQWLLQGSDAPSFDARISGTTKGANYFYGSNYKHPLNPNKTCTVGVNCPIDRCLQYPDWKSFVAGELAHGDMRYNNEYASFMQGDNVGFYGDYEQGFGACSYINYQAREWNTAGVNLYPKGGMFSLISGLRDRITRLGGTIHTNERVTCIRRVTPSTASNTCSGAAADFTNTRYVVTTRSYRIFVRKFLFMAVPNPYLEDTTSIGGDVLNSLRAKRPFARARAQTTATVTMQWQPGQKAWYWDLLDKTGNYSIRQYGDTACFSRIEIVDTPFHRCTNAMKAVYSDFRCRQMYIDLISAAQTSGNYTKLKNRVLIDLQDAFPNVTIPEPILTVGQIFNPAWYWSKPSHDDISNEAHAEWAANPLDNEPICMIGEAYHMYYQGWVEGALRSSRQCLATRLASTPDNQGKLADQLLRGYAARDAIVPGDGSYASKFQEVTPHSGSRYFSNEQWWPYKYDAVPSTGFCHKANHPFVNYKNATVTP